MNAAISIALLLSAAVISFGAEVRPQRPSTAEVAKILCIQKIRVSTADKEQHPKLDGKVIWMATYHISGEQNCSITITLFPNDRIKTDFIEKISANQNDFQKITRDDGDVIYHTLGDRGDQGTFYITTLINHENDWDMTLILSREPGVDESKLPFAIAEDGIKLISEFEAVLRNQEPQQACAEQPATSPESEPEGNDKPQPEAEGRSR
jgi:hypothetical protein